MSDTECETFENTEIKFDPLAPVAVSKTIDMICNSKDRRRKLTSTIWHNFTVLDLNQKVASCDLCGVKLSYRSTVTNMRKHLVRKHNFNNKKDSFFFRPATFKVKKEIHQNQRFIKPQRKKTLTELGGLDGLLLNVMAEEGEDPLGEEEETPQDDVVEEAVLYTTDEVHDYCVTDGEIGQSEHPGDSIVEEKRTFKSRNGVGGQPRFRDTNVSDKVKKNRIMDLQLECLEIKKYTMQMEALMLEHQLNLPRSVYTQTLERSSCVTRSTQTDIGGNNTKVFYVSDTEGSRLNSQHFFSFQTRMDE